jgi:hypothetical protein
MNKIPSYRGADSKTIDPPRSWARWLDDFWNEHGAVMAFIAILVAIGLLGWVSYRHELRREQQDPCAQYVYGRVSITDVYGRQVLTSEAEQTCVAWKPGRAPRK